MTHIPLTADATRPAAAFPPGFLWGTATSAYQIEGGADLDGRTPSIWDEFCARPGAIADGSSGAVATDHYHRYAEDVALMAQLGLTAYRFSVSWSRVLRPDGTVNPPGLDFYDRLVDELLGRRIEPWLTLYHWDLPAWLPGGWLARATAERFAEYAATVHHRLGDRVGTWTTLNEPWCCAFLGHASGEHAPGHTDPAEALLVAHHLLLGHGLAVAALRAGGAARVGVTLNFGPVDPADPGDQADVDAARRIDGTHNRLFLEPILRGRYPGDVVEDAGPLWPAEEVRPGDLETIAAPLDVLGVNYYRSDLVRGPAHRAGSPSAARHTASPHVTAPDARIVDSGLPTTAVGWPVDPDGLRRLLVRLQRDYTGPAGVPLVVTENGAAYEDTVAPDGRVADQHRIGFLREHLAAARRAIDEGVDVRGYLVWSFIDNFEWALGYRPRFGIVRVDEQLRRVPKDSARWLAHVARTGSLEESPGRETMSS